MAKLYKDINTIKLQFLLEATPFTVFKEINFSNKLSEKIFFSEIYVPGGKTSGLDARQVAEIVNFENGIRNAIIEFGNEHARVSLIHIKGYGGCGKTTFVSKPYPVCGKGFYVVLGKTVCDDCRKLGYS